MSEPLSDALLERMDAYWRAATWKRVTAIAAGASPGNGLPCSNCANEIAMNAWLLQARSGGNQLGSTSLRCSSLS